MVIPMLYIYKYVYYFNNLKALKIFIYKYKIYCEICKTIEQI